ncbi:MAG: hypothetical protein K2G93_08460 [Rikenella sp.]|nr:hypothetical protein [Rikenella sp.]
MPEWSIKRLVTPAPGYRRNDSGTLRSVGRDGYSWSSTIPTGSTNAHYLDLSYNEIHPNYLEYRAYGIQLRCLQE